MPPVYISGFSHPNKLKGEEGEEGGDAAAAEGYVAGDEAGFQGWGEVFSEVRVTFAAVFSGKDCAAAVNQGEIFFGVA